MSELKPCPFCGGAPMLRPDHNHSTGIEIECVADRCAAKPAVWEISEPATIAAWNRRAGDAELATLRAKVERLRCTIREAASAIEREATEVLWMPDDAYPAETIVDFLRAALAKEAGDAT